MIIELGVDARLLRLQLDELYGEIDDELDLVVADYLPAGRTVERDTGRDVRAVRRRGPRPPSRLRRDRPRAATTTTSARRSHRRACACCDRVKRLPDETALDVTEHFGGLAKLQRATVDDLMRSTASTSRRLRAIRDTLTPSHRVDHPRPVLTGRQVSAAALTVGATVGTVGRIASHTASSSKPSAQSATPARPDGAGEVHPEPERRHRRRSAPADPARTSSTPSVTSSSYSNVHSPVSGTDRRGRLAAPAGRRPNER